MFYPLKMKTMKNFQLLAFGLLFGLTLQAQDAKQVQVPAAVQSAFSKQFPLDTKAKWEKEKDTYEAEFKRDGKEMSVLFDANGNWLQTETEFKTANLPKAVSEAIQRDYPGYEMEEACIVETNKKETYFEVELEKGKT